MKPTARITLAAISAIGVLAIAVPVIAQQGQMHRGAMMDGGMSMRTGHDGMMGGAFGMMMGGAQSHAMAMFDTDKDGTISPEEMTAGIQGELQTYDADANGSLSLDEFAAMHAAHTRPMPVRAFQMHDPDGDAQVTESEMAAMAAMMQSHMGDKHEGARGMSQGTMDNN